MRRTRLDPFRSIALVGLFALLAAGCGTSTNTESAGGEAAAGTSIVVSTTVLGDIVSNVVGDSASVEILVPVGADPHDYQVSSAQAAAMQAADLVVVNGLRLEEGMHDVVEALEGDGANILEVAPNLEPIPFSGGHANEDDETALEECDPTLGHDDEGEDVASEPGHESCDPHVWMDPLRMAEAARLIATELAALDSGVDWMANADSYADALVALDAEIVAMLDAVPENHRKLVTNHDALGYFAKRYDFEVVGTVIPGGATLANPSSAEMAGLVAVISEEGVNVIFAETIEPSALADSVAAELGSEVEVVELYTGSLDEPGTEAGTYIGMMRINAERVSGALS